MDEYVFCYPVIYGLMPRRTKTDYVKFWKRVNAIFEKEFPGEKMTFISYSTDYELASFKGFLQVFPETPIFLCGFHYVKSLKGKIIELVGKKEMYKDPVLLDIWLNVLKGLMWIPWNDSLVKFFFDYLDEKAKKLFKKNKKPFKSFCSYLYKYYFCPKAMFHYRLWNHFDQLMTYDDPDMTTNSSESVNSGLNKNCPPIRSENGLHMKILRHARKSYKNWIDKVKNDNLTGSKRPKTRTERYDNLKDICDEYDNLSGPERQERLIEFLGLFARRDAIPDKFEFSPDSDTELSNSDNESE